MSFSCSDRLGRFNQMCLSPTYYCRLNTQLRHICSLCSTSQIGITMPRVEPQQLFRKIDSDNTIAACHQVFLASAVKGSYVVRITCYHKHPVFCTYLVKFGFSWRDRRCRFLGSCAVTAHLTNNLWSITCKTPDFRVNCQTHFQWLSTRCKTLLLANSVQFQLTLSHLWACSLLCTASTSASPLGKVNRSSWCFLLLSLGT